MTKSKNGTASISPRTENPVADLVWAVLMVERGWVDDERFMNNLRALDDAGLAALYEDIK